VSPTKSSRGQEGPHSRKTDEIYFELLPPYNDLHSGIVDGTLALDVQGPQKLARNQNPEAC
jgi:hypothetical protein